MWNEECGMWNEECGMRSVECGVRYVSSTSDFVYKHCISVLFSFHIPHSTLHKFVQSTRLLRNLDVLYKVTLAVGFLAIDHEMTA